MPAAIDWTPTMMGLVLVHISEGATLRETGEEFGISAAAIIRQCEADEVFAKQYARAMEIRAERDFEALEDECNAEPRIVEDRIDPAWVQLQRLKVDTRKWMLSKRIPKKYGEKQQVELSGSVELADRLKNADKRIES
jgi:hypothetical protein